jgi:hypothetical protein
VFASRRPLALAVDISDPVAVRGHGSSPLAPTQPHVQERVLHLL